MLWCGEVVEVDETGGRIFVSISNPDQQPCTGTFYVRPFEFLELLNEVYNGQTFAEIRERLLPRLGATNGGAHPRLEGPVSQHWCINAREFLPESQKVSRNGLPFRTERALHMRAIGRMAGRAGKAADGIARLAESSESDAIRLKAWRAILVDQMAVAKFSDLKHRMLEVEEKLQARLGDRAPAR
jgi:hypothetical protein